MLCTRHLEKFQNAASRASYPTDFTALTRSSGFTVCGSCWTSILPVLKYTFASVTPLSDFRALSILATHEGHESSWLRNKVFFMVSLLSDSNSIRTPTIPVWRISFHDVDQLSAQIKKS